MRDLSNCCEHSKTTFFSSKFKLLARSKQRKIFSDKIIKSFFKISVKKWVERVKNVSKLFLGSTKISFLCNEWDEWRVWVTVENIDKSIELQLCKNTFKSIFNKLQIASQIIAPKRESTSKTQRKPRPTKNKTLQKFLAILEKKSPQTKKKRFCVGVSRRRCNFTCWKTIIELLTPRAVFISFRSQAKKLFHSLFDELRKKKKIRAISSQSFVSVFNVVGFCHSLDFFRNYIGWWNGLTFTVRL